MEKFELKQRVVSRLKRLVCHTKQIKFIVKNLDSNLFDGQPNVFKSFETAVYAGETRYNRFVITVMLMHPTAKVYRPAFDLIYPYK